MSALSKKVLFISQSFLIRDTALNLSVTEVYGNPTDTEVLKSFVLYSEEYHLENLQRASLNCSLFPCLEEGGVFEIHIETTCITWLLSY